MNPGICEKGRVEEQKVLSVWRRAMVKRLAGLGIEDRWLVHVLERVLRVMIGILR